MVDVSPRHRAQLVPNHCSNRTLAEAEIRGAGRKRVPQSIMRGNVKQFRLLAIRFHALGVAGLVRSPMRNGWDSRPG